MVKIYKIQSVYILLIYKYLLNIYLIFTYSSEAIDLAVSAIFESNTGLDLKVSKIKLKELYNFATSHTLFYSAVAFMIK